MTIKQQIASEISKVTKDLGLDIAPKVDYPADSAYGDYSTNVAMVIFGKGNTFGKLSARGERGKGKEFRSPMELAGQIAEELRIKNQESRFLEKIEIVKPGFINFWIAEEFFVQKLQNSEKSTSETAESKKGKIGIEHTGPNTNKPLHIGHVRNTVLGMSLVRLKQATGWQAESWNINNDRGIHITKSMWAYKKYGKNLTPENISLEQWKEIQADAGFKDRFDHVFSNKSDHFVGMFYVIGANKYDEAETAKKEMEEMLVAWEKEDNEVRKIWKQMNDWFYKGVLQTLSILGTKFDHEWYESQIYDKGKPIIDKAVKENKLHKAPDGHVEAELSQFKLPNVVLLRSNGTALYITQDIELARQRIKDEKFDYAMVITGHEQNLRFQQLYRVCEILGIADYSKLLHLGYGMVRLKEGKMSSRQGTGITADDLIDEVKAQVKKIMIAQTDDSDFEKRVEHVAIGAIKYAMLKHGVLSDISFDIESSISTEGDSGPYIQYVYARTQSVLLKAGTTVNNSQLTINKLAPGKRGKNNNEPFTLNASRLTLAPEERELLKLLVRFDEVVLDAAERLAPNIVATYLFELAQAFNLFYQKCPIIKAEGDLREFRLFITKSAGETIKKGLQLLGIESPVKM